MKKILGEDTNIAFYEGSKQTFLILHGWGGSEQSWKEVAMILQSNGHTVYVPDIPGFGGTSMSKAYSVSDYVSRVKDFIETMKIENDVILLGHSNGGRIAINFAQKFPDFLKKLILVNSAGIPPKKTLRNSVLGYIAKIGKVFLGLPGMTFVRKIFYKAIGGQDYLNADNPYKKETFLNMLHNDSKEIMKLIKTKTNIIWGAKDTYTPLFMGKEIHKLIQGSTLVIFDDQKHGIHLTDPDRLSNQILEYISEK